MRNLVRDFDSKYNEVLDRLKVFAIDTLTYDLRRFVYRMTFKEVFRYVVAGMFLVLIPTLVVLGVLSSAYTGYLYYNKSSSYPVWILLSLTGFGTAYAFYYFAGRFIFSRSNRMIKLPQAANPAEVFVSRLMMELRREQTQMLDSTRRH